MTRQGRQVMGGVAEYAGQRIEDGKEKTGKLLHR